MPFRFIHSRRTLVGTTFGRTMHTQIPSSHRAADWCESNGVCCVRSAASEWQSSCCTLRAHASGCVMSYVVLVMRMEFFRLAASCCGTRHRPMSSCNPSSRQSPKRLVQTRSGSLSCNRPRLPHLHRSGAWAPARALCPAAPHLSHWLQHWQLSRCQWHWQPAAGLPVIPARSTRLSNSLSASDHDGRHATEGCRNCHWQWPGECASESPPLRELAVRWHRQLTRRVLRSSDGIHYYRPKADPQCRC